MENLFVKKFSDHTLKPINEVAEELAIEPYVLRFWETKFQQITPSKGRGNRRLYNKENIETIKSIKDLLYNKGFTIEGAKKYLSGEIQVGVVANSNKPDPKFNLEGIVKELEEVQQKLRLL